MGPSRGGSFYGAHIVVVGGGDCGDHLNLLQIGAWAPRTKTTTPAGYGADEFPSWEGPPTSSAPGPRGAAGAAPI